MPRVKDCSILIVDDQEENTQLLETILENAGYRHTLAINNPLWVDEMIQAQHFNLILLDIVMPQMDGFEVMKSLRKMKDYKHVPILVLTAENNKETCRKALSMGATDFVTKPFDAIEVLHRIHNMLNTEVLHMVIKADNQLLEKRVQERTQKIHDTQLQITHFLGKAVEFRDNETGLHVIRMSKISRVLALAAGLGEQQADLILHASPMHDIGKIGIPDAILLKPGKFNADEWKIMQRHAEIGGQILATSDIDVIKLGCSIAWTHHEKWDGSGYPHSLKGEAIPIEGRISAIADVYDALTSARPYKEPWPIAKAVEYINEQSGKHFEPKLVQFFNENLDDISEISTRYCDNKETLETLLLQQMIAKPAPTAPGASPPV
ncbi:MAG: response regulator [Pseudomonadales bacterium]|nr:response regulator [Pseudomonadales bacterium]